MCLDRKMEFWRNTCLNSRKRCSRSKEKKKDLRMLWSRSTKTISYWSSRRIKQRIRRSIFQRLLSWSNSGAVRLTDERKNLKRKETSSGWGNRSTTTRRIRLKNNLNSATSNLYPIQITAWTRDRSQAAIFWSVGWKIPSHGRNSRFGWHDS